MRRGFSHQSGAATAGKLSANVVPCSPCDLAVLLVTAIAPPCRSTGLDEDQSKPMPSSSG